MLCEARGISKQTHFSTCVFQAKMEASTSHSFILWVVVGSCSHLSLALPSFLPLTRYCFRVAPSHPSELFCLLAYPATTHTIGHNFDLAPLRTCWSVGRQARHRLAYVYAYNWTTTVEMEKGQNLNYMQTCVWLALGKLSAGWFRHRAA